VAKLRNFSGKLLLRKTSALKSGSRKLLKKLVKDFSKKVKKLP
jgi:hypothetical protein